MDTLTEKVRAVMKGYARKGLNSQNYLTQNEDCTVLSVITVVQNRNDSFVSLLVRILGETIVIERDQNDKPLVQALIQNGIPRSQIILTYAGEAGPAAV